MNAEYVDPNELQTLREQAAELRSLKQSILESPLKDLFPKKEISFHDKVLFAIHNALAAPAWTGKQKGIALVLSKLPVAYLHALRRQFQYRQRASVYGY